MKALLIVDVQNDFLPGGALPAPDGNKVIPVINRLADKFDYVIASRDWHPEDSIHFKKWPAHCVANTMGAGFPDNLNTEIIDKFLIKGTNDKDDGYSAFEATNINLNKFLKYHHIDELFVTGLTTEYCVKNSVLDALKSGYKTHVIRDAVEGVKANPGDEEKAFEEMEKAGATLMISDQL
jgi:nicotinamidase/pyrazinamidase